MLCPKISKPIDIVVVGGGIVGTATAMTLLERHPGLRVCVIESESRFAAHQTGHNSGVIHSGLYYRPGSMKAMNCALGRERMFAFCERYGIRHERCGKVVVALDENEAKMLSELEQRGRANGLEGLKKLSQSELREREPHAICLDALLVPQTGIVDYTDVVTVYATRITAMGGELMLNTTLVGLDIRSNNLILETSQGALHSKAMINCAGLQSDRVARLCGVEPGVHIIPFRGDYYELLPQRYDLVRHLIYPVPDPRYPFLGVHFTRMIKGGIEAGPNAVLACRRDGYGRFSFKIRDALELVMDLGFWRMGLKHWHTGLMEFRRAMSRSLFVKSLQRLIPEITSDDLCRGGCGVRAQAVDRNGRLLDDFHILESKQMLHVLNAPSPAATASLSIAQYLSIRAESTFGLGEPEKKGDGIVY